MRFFARWPLTLLLALVTVALSIVGYYLFLPLAQWPSPLDWLMSTISLFKMSWHWSEKTLIPWPLQVARFTGAFFTLSALGKVWMTFFGEQMKQLRLNRWQRHVAVCGLGRKGLQLALDFRNRGKRVVVVDVKADEDDQRLCRQHGILLETGDATNDVTLEAIGVDRAAYVMAVCRDDHTNLEIAMESLARYIAARRTSPLDCYVHLVNLPLRVLLQRHELLKRRPRAFALHFFNIYENAARELFAQFPPDKAVACRWQRVHLVIVGVTLLGEAIATQAARIAHYRDLRSVRLTIIDEQADARGEQLLSRQPALADVCELRFLSMRLTETRFTKLGFLEEGVNERPTIILCLDQDEANVGVALTLAEQSGGKIPLLANVSERRGLAKLLSASTGELEEKGIYTFGAVEKVCGWNLLHDERLDALAKAFARYYQRRYGGAGWEDLSEDLRNSNRAAADHIDVKLRTIGCRRLAADQCSTPFTFTKEEVELLSRMEHERWSADRRLNGWIYGANRDDQRKIHDNLLPWEKLTPEAKEKDSDQVRDIPAVLQEIGEAITRE